MREKTSKPNPGPLNTGHSIRQIKAGSLSPCPKSHVQETGPWHVPSAQAAWRPLEAPARGPSSSSGRRTALGCSSPRRLTLCWAAELGAARGWDFIPPLARRAPMSTLLEALTLLLSCPGVSSRATCPSQGCASPSLGQLGTTLSGQGKCQEGQVWRTALFRPDLELQPGSSSGSPCHCGQFAQPLWTSVSSSIKGG